MECRVLAAGLLALTISTAATAADLDEGPPPDRHGAYDDPRYDDVYKHPAPPPPRPYADPPGPRDYVYRDDDDDYDRGPPRWRGSGPRYGSACVPREVIRVRLLRQGWNDFQRGEEPTGDLAHVRARRPSGRLFALTIERCSGEIVEAHPLEPRPYGPFAYGGPPRRWERPF